jgi:hypothetical protein
VSIQCPNCGGALPIEAKDHFVTCRFCSTASRVPVRMRSQLFKDGVEQDRWWVLVEGKSPLREKLLSKASKREAHLARQREQRAAAERREQQPSLPRAAPAPVAATPPAARKNPLAFISIGIALVGGALWFAMPGVSQTEVEPTQPEPKAGKTEKGGDVKRPKAKKKKTEKEKPIPAAAFPLMTGCACKIPDPKTGKTTGVQLGMLTSHDATMSMGSVVRKMFGARYMLRGQGWDVLLEPGPEDATPPSIEGIRVDFAVGCSSDVLAIVGTRAVTGYSVETKKRIWSSLLPERFGPERLVEGDLAVHCHEAKVAGGMLTVTPAPGEPLRPVRVRLKDGQIITQ